MAVTREHIQAEIDWYNQQVVSVKNKLEQWLKEQGHKVTASENEITKNEELSGPYKTKQFNFVIDNDIKISLIPYGIWLIGAKGRIDISGPSGTEKLLFFFSGGPGMTTEMNDGSGRIIERSSHKYFDNVDEENWYWYDDSTYRKVSKFTKDIVQPLLERLQ